jgi:glutamate synthase (NADPH/NADH) small chain
MKTEMPTQDAKKRITNFEEVALGYSQEQAQLEAARCLNCKLPLCKKGCPVDVAIPEFIAEIKNRNYQQAYELIKKTNAFPQVCGRVCPQETQCEANCVVGIKSESVAIGRLERFVGDYCSANSENIKEIPIDINKTKVAIVGSGPASLSCAYDLAKNGYQVTIFEVLHQAGGVLIYGIPEFRLPKTIVAKEINTLKSLGVQFELSTLIGKTLDIDDLFNQDYKAVFLGTGAGLPLFLNIAGENLTGVYSANEFLTRVNLLKANENNYDTPLYLARKTIVVGGGNVAMDAARVAKRLGNDATIVYRRTMNELPARKEEIQHAIQEGVVFELLQNPTKLIADANNQVKAMEVEIMELGPKDESGRCKPVGTGVSKELSCDCVIMAIGTTPNPLISQTTENLEIGKGGTIIVDDKLQTSLPMVYAGGDVVSGAATVISAMGAGKKAAASIMEILK